jgi:hypothetical protein
VVLPSNVGQIFRKTGRTVAKDSELHVHGGGTVRVPWEEEDYRSEVAWEILKG